uniref:Ig-like domain-containing protein n=1 Tax=Mastacembelus armatus TaxID=205130 RepID=A0A3Q3LXC8_9TELE
QESQKPVRLRFVVGLNITITAEPGQNVTLTCRAPSSTEIRTVEWTRPGPIYVFVYRNKKFDPTNQHPSFKERVELKDSQMKDGDVSVTLKNVTFTDTGTYECHLAQGQTDPLKPINITHLTVTRCFLFCSSVITYLTPHTCSLLQVMEVGTRMEETRMDETGVVLLD